MRVGIYVDGYNLYYSGRRWFGRGTPGWRWLSPRALATTVVAQRRNWTQARVDRVVYCTARVDAADNPTAYVDQDVYLKAITGAGAVDHIEFGRYVARVKQVPLAAPMTTGSPRVLWSPCPYSAADCHLPSVVIDKVVTSFWPLCSFVRRKAVMSMWQAISSLDVLTGMVDAAVLISNDSDLGLPLKIAREHVPVGVVNPSPGRMAGALLGAADKSAGRHWWRQLQPPDFTQHQLPNPAAGFTRPLGW